MVSLEDEKKTTYEKQHTRRRIEFEFQSEKRHNIIQPNPEMLIQKYIPGARKQ